MTLMNNPLTAIQLFLFHSKARKFNSIRMSYKISSLLFFKNEQTHNIFKKPLWKQKLYSLNNVVDIPSNIQFH